GTTNECLSQEPADGHCQGLSARLRSGNPNTFFRMLTTQPVEGAAGADLAFRALGKKRAFVISDQTSFGLGIATTFVARFVRDGGTIVDPSELGAFDPTPPSSAGRKGSCATTRRRMATRWALSACRPTMPPGS